MRAAVVTSVTLAVVTSLWAWVPWRSAATRVTEAERPLMTAGGSEVKADAVASLRVVRWDAQEKAPKVFEVARRNNNWIIPSHFDYPADKGARVGETAGGVLNVPRGPQVGTEATQHAEFGVIDPLKEGLADEEGRGQRVTLKDEGGAVLVDLIVGKEVAGGGEGLRYVRDAGADAVYTARVSLDISTAFRDWVETDLLKVSRPAIHSVRVLDYKVDTRQGTIDRRSSTTFRKETGADGAWTSESTPQGKRVSTKTLDAILDEATGLRLSGVRPFDPAWLQSRGFYVTEKANGQVDIVGNEGSLELSTDDGLRYRLFFGNIALGDDEDKSAKVSTTAPATQPSLASANSPNRYMAVFVEYDPALHTSAVPPTTQPTTQSATPTRPAPTTQQVADGQKQAQEKMARFTRFFYVISDDSFRKLRPKAEDLFESATVDKEKLPGEKVPADTQATTAPTGLTWFDLKPGTGAEAADGDTVSVHYTGWLESDGTQFDSSITSGNPFSFTLAQGSVIKGWDQGVKGMKVGGKRKLVIPPDLGYGASGSPPKIPANARLVFDVELLDVKKPGAK